MGDDEVSEEEMSAEIDDDKKKKRHKRRKPRLLEADDLDLITENTLGLRLKKRKRLLKVSERDKDADE